MSTTRSVALQWTGSGLQFRATGTEPPAPTQVLIDGDNEEGASPMQHLLMAAGACSAVDVVVILQKMRIGLTRVDVSVTGERAADDPKRFVSIRFGFNIAGDGLDHAKAERAVKLSVEKYCSVLHTLAADLEVSYDIVLS